MKKTLTFLITLILIVSINPVFASAKTVNAGIGPNSFFYFLDIAFENVNLFFTFNAEKKAKTALEYADERVAELAEISKDKTPEIYIKTVNRYQKQISYAKEISAKIEQLEKKENILTLITEREKDNSKIIPVVVIGGDVEMPEVLESEKNENEKRPITNFMKMGVKGEEVCILQKILKMENVLNNKATCYYGSKTHWAVSRLVGKYGYFQTPDNFGTIDETAMNLINKLYMVDKNGSIQKKLATNVKVVKPTFQNKIKPVTQNQPKKSFTLDEILGKKPEKKPTNDIVKIKPVISQKGSDILNSTKGELEKVYTAIEISKSYLKTELEFLNDDIEHLDSVISMFTDCSISNASLLADINSRYSRYIRETKERGQKSIDAVKYYPDNGESVRLRELDLEEKIKEHEKDREIAINSVKVSCSDSLKNSLKDTLDTLRKDTNEISNYSNSYTNLQRSIVAELGKIKTAIDKTRDGQVVDISSVYDSYSKKVIEIITTHNSANSSVKSKVRWAKMSYSQSKNSAFESASFMQDIRSNFDSIQDKAQADYENWKIKNTPVKCWSDTNYSGGLINGKSETSIRCDTGATNPVRCWSTTEYKGGINGTSQTSMRCE